MPGTGRALKRLEAFYAERAMGASEGAGFGPLQAPAADRLEALREYRRLKRPPAALGPVPNETDWIPIGPAGVRFGQAGGEPVVSGRVSDLRVSADGQRVYVATANGGVWRSLDAGTNWEPMFDAEEFNPTAVSVDSLACGAIALVEGPSASAADDVLYVGLGEPHAFLNVPWAGYFGAGMVRSPDGGATWVREASLLAGVPVPSPMPSPPPSALDGAGVYAIAVDPTNASVAVAATTQGVFRRTGPGVWTQEAPLPIPLGDAVSGVVSYRSGADVCFAVVAATGGVVSEWSSGRPAPGWVALGSTLPAGATARRTTLGVSASTPPVVYALASKDPVDDKTTHGVYRLAIGTNAWVALEDVPNVLGKQGHYDLAVAVDPQDENIIYLAGAYAGNGAAISRARVTPPAAAATTTKADYTHIGDSVHPDVHCLVFRQPAPDELWVGCDGGVFVTYRARSSGADVFEARNTGLATLTLMGLAQHHEEETWIFCGAQDNGGLRYTGDEVWDLQLAGDGGDTVFDSSAGDRFLNGYVHSEIRRASIDGRRFSDSSVNLPGSASALFYPPIVQAPRTPTFVVVGAEAPYVSTNFGSNWTAIPIPAGWPAGAQIRSLGVATDGLFYAGWQGGQVTRHGKQADGTWTATDLTPPDAVSGLPNLERRPVTSIAIDQTDPNGMSIFITLGGRSGAGARVRRHNATVWTNVATGLLDVQHNRLCVDDVDPKRLFVGADLGVWQLADFTIAAPSWTAMSSNLPDVAVLDLDIFSRGAGADRFRLLRATTHGRGVFEFPLEPGQSDVELYLRANQLDQRRRPARAEARHPAQPGRRSRLDESPDVFIELPDQNGRFRLPADRRPSLTDLLSLPTVPQILASTPGNPVTTRVHVVVRSRGVRRTRDVRVSLLVGPEGEPLPDDYVAYAMGGGALTEQHGWIAVASVTAPEIWAGNHAVVTFEISSDLLPAADESLNKQYRLLATVSHADDLFPDHLPAPTTDPIELVTHCHKAALKRATVVSGEGRGAAAGGTGLLVAMSTAVLAHRRLSAIRDDLRGKVASATVHPVERRVLAMTEAGVTALEAGPKPDLSPFTQAPAPGIGTFAVLGSLGFELPTYTSALLPGGTWVAETLRRGTADPHTSKVAVPTTELPLALAARGIPNASGADLHAVQGFSTGMLAGAAAGIVLGPQLADLLAQDSNADWSPASSAPGLRAAERLLRKNYLGGPTVPMTRWLPPADSVPSKLWEHYIKAIETTHGLPGSRQDGFLVGFDPGHWLTPDRLRTGYQLLLDDARTEDWGFWPWFFAVSPLMVMPSVAFAFSRTLPHGSAFIDGGDLNERAWFEVLMLSMGLGSLAPFLYSMIMWSKINDHTEAFVTALIMGLARMALVTGAIATSGEESQAAGTRWAGLFPPVIGADAYAAIRAAADSGRHPGNAKVFGLQTVPALTGMATLCWLGLARAIIGGDPPAERTEGDRTKADVTFWLTTLVGGAAAVAAAGIPTALAMSNGAGWRSWFLRRTGHLPLLSSVSSVGVEPLTPAAAARVYPADTLWAAPGNPDDLDQLSYPAGMRPILRFWSEGSDDLEVKYGEDSLTFRRAGVEQVVALPDPPTTTAITRRLESEVDGLKTEVVTPDLADVPLPAPKTIADLGDTATLENAPSLREHFVRVPKRKSQAISLHQAPRVEQSVVNGRLAGVQDRYLVVPATALDDDRETGIRDAADFAALLVAASARTLGAVNVDPPEALPDPQVHEVRQVFRRWNLNERRVDEWKSLMTGHGATAPPADPERQVGGRRQNVMIRPQPTGYAPQTDGRAVAEAMGWLPLWRAWLRIAGTVGIDVGSDATDGNPEITLPGEATRRVRNRELTDGVRFLLDLGAT